MISPRPKSVRTTVRLAEAPNAGQTIYEYDPGGRGAEDYSAVAHFLTDLPQRDHAEA